MEGRAEIDRLRAGLGGLLRRIERRIQRRFCRHVWRPSRSRFGYVVCERCGKMSAD